MPKLRVERFTISLTSKDTIINALTKIAEAFTIDLCESTLKF